LRDSREVTPERIRRAHTMAAKLVLRDPIFMPIFERLETEVRALDAQRSDDPISRARAALSVHKAMA
jgi:hypothetical protein